MINQLWVRWFISLPQVFNSTSPGARETPGCRHWEPRAQQHPSGPTFCPLNKYSWEDKLWEGGFRAAVERRERGLTECKESLFQEEDYLSGSGPLPASFSPRLTDSIKKQL